MSPLLLEPPGTPRYKVPMSVVRGELRAEAQGGALWISSEHRTPVQDAAEQEFAEQKQAFLGIAPKILAQYVDKFVASSRGTILDSDQDLPTLVRRISDGPYRDAPIYITKVGEDQNELRIDTPFFD